MPTFSLAQRNMELDVHNARMLVEFAAEAPDNATLPVRGATAGGDERKLRGIPAIGRGVQGVIRGTAPGSGRHIDEWTTSDTTATVANHGSGNPSTLALAVT